MNIKIYTWGTGAAFGRELGNPVNRQKRHFSATSILFLEHHKILAHFLVDAGSPCTESIIDAGILLPPRGVFITHPHSDHYSDLNKLVVSRIRGLRVMQQSPQPFLMIGSRDCLYHPKKGMLRKFGYFEDAISWVPVPEFDVWYVLEQNSGNIFAVDQLDINTDLFPLEFKILPVHHSVSGSCLYIFRSRNRTKKLVITGDFDRLDEPVIENPDLRDPDLILMDCNTMHAGNTNHSNLDKNIKLLRQWLSGQKKTQVLFYHISGFEDWEQGFFDHVPTEADWQKEIDSIQFPEKIHIRLASDGTVYSV